MTEEGISQKFKLKIIEKASQVNKREQKGLLHWIKLNTFLF